MVWGADAASSRVGVSKRCKERTITTTAHRGAGDGLAAGSPFWELAAACLDDFKVDLAGSEGT